MNFSDLTISTKKNSSDSDSSFSKKGLRKNTDKVNIKKNINLYEFKRSNSLPMLNYQNKQRFGKKKKFFHDKLIEKSHPNCFANSKFNYSKKTINNTHSKNKKKINTNNSKKINNTIIQMNLGFSKKYYSNYIPKQNEMNNNACQKPQYFPMTTFLGINTSKNENGNENYLDLKESLFCKENDCYKKINKTEHILLNHLLNKNSKINSATVRYRHKNITFIYYK